LCTGKFTKKIESFQAQEKEYTTTLKLGATTPSFDMESEEDSTGDISTLTNDLIEKAVKKFQGEQDQTPPIFSAVKVNGKRAFNYARNGEEVKLQPKRIVITNIEVEAIDLPYIKIRVECSKGTYIRALARDIGEELKCGAYLTELRRTRIGEFKVEDSIKVDYFLENLNLFETI
jgi:tRNA pseudouridine55 synthase